MADHTPGPWEIEHCAKHDGYHIRTSERGGFALVAYGEEGWANARLIAAAPDLLAACEAIADLLDGLGGASKPKALVLAAIAKAKGEPDA